MCCSFLFKDFSLEMSFPSSLAEYDPHASNRMIPGFNYSAACKDTASPAFQASFVVELHSTVFPFGIELRRTSHDEPVDQALIAIVLIDLDMGITVNVKYIMSQFIFYCHSHL